MKTEKTVGDEKPKITDEQIGKLQRKTNEIIRRINEGTISCADALASMQDIIEGKTKRLRLDLIPQKKWWEENGVIYFKVISDGTTGEQWINRLEKREFDITDQAKSILLSRDFKPTNGIVYTIAVLKSNLFADDERGNKKIRREALERKLLIPNPEISCLIMEMFMDEDGSEFEAMGISWIANFHIPIKTPNVVRSFLITGYAAGCRWLDTQSTSSIRYNNCWGFAFEVSQEKA